MRLFRIVWWLAGRLFRAARRLLECAQLDVAGGFAQPHGELRRGLGGDETPQGNRMKPQAIDFVDEMFG